MMRYVRATAVGIVVLAFGGAGLGPGEAHAGRLDQLVTNLFGGDGPDLDRQVRFQLGADQPFTVAQPSGRPDITYNVPGGGTFLETDGFDADTMRQLDTFNAWFSDRVKESIYPRHNSTNGSFTYYLGDDDEYQPTTRTLGPVLAERAQTIGAANLNIGFNYTQERFRRIEGHQLNNFFFRFTHANPVANTPSAEVIDTQINIDLRRTVLNLNANFGLTNRWDVGLTVPIVETAMRVNSFSRVNFQANSIAGARKQAPDTFAFCNERFVNDLTRNRNGIEVYDATGFNPTGLRVRNASGQILTENSAPLSIVPLRTTVGPVVPVTVDPQTSHPFNDFRSPRCDGREDSNLSSVDSESWGIGDLILSTKFHAIEETNILPDFAVSSRVKFNTGDSRQFHGNGAIDFLTTFIASKEIAMFTPHLNLGLEFGTGPSERDNVQYILGTDVRLHDRVSLAVDLLGRHQFRRDSFGDDLLDISFGGKINPPYVGDVVITGSAIWPLNDQGLRSEVLYTFGLEFLL